MLFEIATLVLVILLLSPNVYSLLNTNVLIRSSGSIFYMSPIHVEGKDIKDSLGNTVYLRGVGHFRYATDPTGMWALDGVGEAWYSGQFRWNEQAVRDNMKAMKSWGFSLVRFHTTADWWLQDTVSVGGYTGSYRDNLKRTIEIAAEEGLYVLFDLWGLVNGDYGYSQGWSAPRMPFPPYLTHPEEEAVFSSKQDFVDYWISVANELKDYPNVLFELYNEPHSSFDISYTESLVERSDWFDACQQAVDAIRATGSKNLIVLHWYLGNVPYVTGFSQGGGLDWVEDCPVTDTEGNLVYSMHCYRTYYNPTWYDGWDYDYTYAAMENMLVDYVVDTLEKPVILGEMGVNMWENDVTVNPESGLTNRGQELAWAANVLDVCNQWGVHYAVWSWEVIDQWYILSQTDGPMIPPPSTWGQVLVDAVAEGGTIIPP